MKQSDPKRARENPTFTSIPAIQSSVKFNTLLIPTFYIQFQLSNPVLKFDTLSVQPFTSSSSYPIQYKNQYITNSNFLHPAPAIQPSFKSNVLSIPTCIHPSSSCATTVTPTVYVWRQYTADVLIYISPNSGRGQYSNLS